MLSLRPTSVTSHCIGAETMPGVGVPWAALLLARKGLQLEQEQGGREPYHAALLHLLVAKALAHGYCLVGGEPVLWESVSVAELRQVSSHMQPWRSPSGRKDGMGWHACMWLKGQHVVEGTVLRAAQPEASPEWRCPWIVAKLVLLAQGVRATGRPFDCKALPATWHAHCRPYLALGMHCTYCRSCVHPVHARLPAAAGCLPSCASTWTLPTSVFPRQWFTSWMQQQRYGGTGKCAGGLVCRWAGGSASAQVRFQMKLGSLCWLLLRGTGECRGRLL